MLIEWKVNVFFASREIAWNVPCEGAASAFTTRPAGGLVAYAVAAYKHRIGPNICNVTGPAGTCRCHWRHKSTAAAIVCLKAVVYYARLRCSLSSLHQLNGFYWR